MSEPRRVLITGCSSGFGRLTARELAARGHVVVASMRAVEGRNREAAGELRRYGEEVPGQVHVVEIDVGDDASVRTGVERALEAAGPLEAVVNNAGHGTAGLTEAFTPEQILRCIDVHAVGSHRVNRAVLPSMRERGEGLLVHVSSVMGRIVIPFAGAYTAAKWAMEGLAESYRYELSAAGIDVVVVEPGGFPTDFLEKVAGPADEEREASCGSLRELPDRVWGGMAERIGGREAPDPSLVARAIADLVEAEPGERPFRTVVDPLMGGEAPEAVNRTSREVQRELFARVGIEDLLGVAGGGSK